MLSSKVVLGLLSLLVFGGITGGIAGIYTYFHTKNMTIQELQRDLLAAKTEINRQNAELQRQAKEFSMFNARSKEYDAQLASKYSTPPPKTKSTDCDLGYFESLLERSFR